MSPYIEYESPCVLYESPMSNGKKVMCRVNVFQMYIKGHGQGHMIKI